MRRPWGRVDMGGNTSITSYGYVPSSCSSCQMDSNESKVVEILMTGKRCWSSAARAFLLTPSSRIMKTPSSRT